MPGNTTDRPQNIIIDTDVGVDDAWALMMVLSRVEALAITTVHGNVDVDQATRNACLILDLMDSQAPLYRGASGPLMGARKISSVELMMADGLGGYSAQLPPSTRNIENQPAALALVQLARQRPREVTLLALGPLTNLALALRLDEGFAGNIKRLVVMGGAVEGHGNTSAVAEFNIFADPEAAQVVFSAGFTDAWLLPWETSLRNPLAWEEYELLKQLPSPRARFAVGAMESLAVILKEKFGAPGLILPDPLAAALCLEPGLARQATVAPLAVETVGEVGRGLTAVNWGAGPQNGNTVRVVREIDTAGAFALLKNSISHVGQTVRLS